MPCGGGRCNLGCGLSVRIRCMRSGGGVLNGCRAVMTWLAGWLLAHMMELVALVALLAIGCGKGGKVMRMSRKQKAKIRNRAEAFAGGEGSRQVANPTELPAEFHPETGRDAAGLPPAPVAVDGWRLCEFGVEEAGYLAAILREEVERGEYKPRIELAQRLLEVLEELDLEGGARV